MQIQDPRAPLLYALSYSWQPAPAIQHGNPEVTAWVYLGYHLSIILVLPSYQSRIGCTELPSTFGMWLAGVRQSKWCSPSVCVSDDRKNCCTSNGSVAVIECRSLHELLCGISVRDMWILCLFIEWIVSRNRKTREPITSDTTSSWSALYAVNEF